MSEPTKDKRAWFDEIVKFATELDGLVLDVGFFGDTDGGEIATIALFNEFGTRRIPQRPFMRATVDEEEDKVQVIFERSIYSKAVKSADGAISPQGVLMRCGTHVVSAMKRSIRDWQNPANAPSVQRRKGRGRILVNNPLIDTGTMRKSVTLRIRRREEVATQ